MHVLPDARSSRSTRLPVFPLTTMSSASTSKPEETTKKAEEAPANANTQPTLGVLEEDDEFEEFVAQGELSLYLSPPSTVACQ